MDIEKLILSILGFFGLIFIFVIIYYFIRRWMDQSNSNNTTTTWPPPSFMKTSGAQCPDYWINTGNSGGMNTCENRFNLPVIKRENLTRCANVNCFDENSNNAKSFNTITNWPVKDRNEIADRCLWRDCCVSDKYNKSIASSWIGVDTVCNSS